MDSHSDSQPQPTGNSFDDQPEILAPPILSENVPITAGSAANSSVGQQSNSPITQVEVDSLLRRVYLNGQCLNELFRRNDADWKAQLESYMDQKINEQMTSVEQRVKEIQQSFQDELDRLEEELSEAERKLVDSESLKTQISQLYTEESAKLTSVQQQFESEKQKNRQKDQMLAEQQNELTEKSTEIYIKSAEIHNKSGEIVKLRQTAQSLRVDLASKSDDFLRLKSEVKSALEAELNCSICSQPMTEAVVTVECGHTFCMGCIDEWINQGNQTCPFCRSECHRSAPVLAISQLQAKLLSCVNGEQPIGTQPNGENLPSGNNNDTS